MSPVGAAALLALLLVVAVVGFIVITTHSAVAALRTRIDRAWGNIEAVLRQRHDQLPALVDAVRDEMRFEREVVEEVARQRARYAPDAPIADQGPIAADTSAAVRSLLAAVERNPQLQSDEDFLRRRAEIERLEAQIVDRRELYNDQVLRYHTTIAQLPAALLAAPLGWRPLPFFVAGTSGGGPPAVAIAAQVDAHGARAAGPRDVDAGR